MNRDFKGVWIPREIWESRIPLKDLESIINSVYFTHSLSIRLWRLLRDRGWSEWIVDLQKYQFTKEFNSLWTGGKNE